MFKMVLISYPNDCVSKMTQRVCDCFPCSLGECVEVGPTVEDSCRAGGTGGCQNHAQQSCGVLPYKRGGVLQTVSLFASFKHFTLNCTSHSALQHMDVCINLYF